MNGITQELKSGQAIFRKFSADFFPEIVIQESSCYNLRREEFFDKISRGGVRQWILFLERSSPSL